MASFDPKTILGIAEKAGKTSSLRKFLEKYRESRKIESAATREGNLFEKIRDPDPDSLPMDTVFAPTKEGIAVNKASVSRMNAARNLHRFIQGNFSSEEADYLLSNLDNDIFPFGYEKPRPERSSISSWKWGYPGVTR
jgi:hypothetical protein